MNSRWGLSAALSASLFAAACGNDDPTPSPALVEPTFEQRGEPVTTLSGFTYDPEAFTYMMLECGPTCEAPPGLFAFSPIFLRSVVEGASVQIIDEVNAPVPGGEMVTKADGTWVTNVPTTEKPYRIVTSGGKIGPYTGPAHTLPDVPETEYVPTRSVTEIFSSYSSACIGQVSVAMGKTGFLDAIARKLTAEGKPTTADDLLDPAKYRGVIVWLNYAPMSSPYFVLPGFATGITANAGRVFHFNWVNPNASLPPDQKALQSPRGFIAIDDPLSMNGLAAVVVPASDELNSIEITPYDPAEPTPEGRPWWNDPVTIELVPGTVIFQGLKLEFDGVKTIRPEVFCRKLMP